MILRSPFSILTLAMVALVGACAPGDSDAEGDAMTEAEPEMTAEESLDALRDEWVASYNAGDVDAVAALYTDSAWILNADQSVIEGREAQAAALGEAVAGSPTSSVTTEDRMVFGDQAVAWGNYDVEVAPEGAEPMDWSGAWIGYFKQIDGDWKIDGMLTNYDAMPPEGMPWDASTGEAPPEESTLTELIGQYETAFNAHDAAAVADMYTEDATVSFAFGPVLEGREAIAADLEDRFGERTTSIDIHGVGTADLDATHKIDAGWYELTDPESGEAVQTGMYFNLVEQAEDGTWKIKWGMSNGMPAGAAQAADAAASGG